MPWVKGLRIRYVLHRFCAVRIFWFTNVNVAKMYKCIYLHKNKYIGIHDDEDVYLTGIPSYL